MIDSGDKTLKSDSQQQSIADSLEAEKKLLPYMPYLLQDLWALGSSVDKIIDLIGTLPLTSEKVNVLDLGCGKGAVSVQIAAKFGFAVVGVDAMHEFTHDARKKASEYKVSELCSFIEGDIRNYVVDTHNFDIVILASLGGIFGNNRDSIKTLRTQVKPGGYIIIDDGYLKKRELLDRQGYEHYRNYEKTVAELTAFDDLLIREVSTTDVSKEINNEYLHLIGKRIVQLIDRHPDLENDLNNYLDTQRDECGILDKELDGRIWILQKVVD